MCPVYLRDTDFTIRLSSPILYHSLSSVRDTRTLTQCFGSKDVGYVSYQGLLLTSTFSGLTGGSLVDHSWMAGAPVSVNSLTTKLEFPVG